jgi:hypothetical protein
MGENIKGYDPLAICGCKSEADCPVPLITEPPPPPNYLLYFIIGIVIVIVLGMLVYIRKL